MAERKTVSVNCAHAPDSNSDHLAFLESLGGVLTEITPRDFIVLLENFNAHMDNNGKKNGRRVIGRSGMLDPSHSSVFSVDEPQQTQCLSIRWLTSAT